MTSIFSKIVSREIPAYIVAENENYLAFLDIMPLTKGHALVIPKIETDYIFDLDDTMFSGLHIFAKKVAIAIKKEIKCNRIGIAVIGMEVPHAHIHLIPINSMDDMNFQNKKLKLPPQEMEAIADKIKSSFSN